MTLPQRTCRLPSPSRARTWRLWWAGEHGRVSAFLVTMVSGILALAGLTLDGGLALAAKAQAIGDAQAAARAGAQALDLTAYRDTGTVRLDPTQAVDAAHRYLTGIGATGAVSVADNTVTVAITTTYHTQLLGLVGISALTVTGRGSAIPQQGVLQGQP